MEVDEIHCNFPNGSRNLADVHKMDEEDDGERNKTLSPSSSAAVDLGGGLGRFYGWPSSRIVRVSRASGGKDRHSKVLTSKGLRDRRVRLSVNTAIQFYDLQDRLGYDQPSKAVEWLLKAAAASICELPPMSNPFPDTPKQLSDEKRLSTDHLCFESAEVDMDGGGGGGDPRFSHQVTKSSGADAACSSTSETSKGSGLSLSRSESRIKARERAKGRVAEKEKETESSHVVAGSFNPISHTTSFTELLSGGINPNHDNNNNIDDGGGGGSRHWSATPMDYFTSGLLARPSQMHLQAGNPFTFGVTAEQHQQELQHISFLSDLGNHHHHHNGDYNLNFTISSSSAENSSGLPGFIRGTLQSNNSAPPQSQSPMLSQLQRYTNTNNINSDGSPQGFYMGTTASPVENHHNEFPTGYDARLQLCYGNNHNNNGQKGKGKN